MNNYLQSVFGLAGKRAVVTGAARGLGKSMACALAGAGADVLIHFHSSRGPAAETVAEIEANGGNAWCHQADLTNSSDAEALFTAVAEKWGGLDILVNNAGDIVERCSIEDFRDDLLEQVIGLNINSMVYATRHAIPLLRQGNNPNVINIGSVAGFNGGGAGSTMYATSKGAVHTFTYGLAKELSPDIRVNAIAPGVIMTDFHRRHTADESLERFAANTPVGRIGNSEDLAAAVLFLAGPGAGFVTGSVVDVNGGLWVR